MEVLQIFGLWDQEIDSNSKSLKGLLQDLTKILIAECPLKMMKNAFYFMLKAIFALPIFTFSPYLFDHVGKWLDKKAKVNIKIYDITGWIVNNIHITQHLQKQKQLGNKIWSVIRI